MTPIRKIRRKAQLSRRDIKPEGFWYSIDGDWERWCRENEFDGLHEFRYRVTLGRENLVALTSCEELDAFHRYWFIDNEMVQDWRLVAKEFDGIEIAPYLWERRLLQRTRWYYPWDCASGIIWRPRGVKVELA
jgi:hypothetical protein